MFQCILQVAEEAAEQFDLNLTESENYTYYSSKYSPINDMSIDATIKARGDPKPLPEIIAESPETYRRMYLDPDTHFYNIPVNTTHSSVHVPTNVYDKSKHIKFCNFS